MAKRPMRTPGAPAASRGSAGGTKRSPLAPINGASQPSGSPLVDDASSKVLKGTLRPRHQTPDGDGALGTKASRTRTATNASAQFRITSKLPGPTSPEAAKTLANGPLLPAVMGSKQEFIRASAL